MGHVETQRLLSNNNTVLYCITILADWLHFVIQGSTSNFHSNPYSNSQVHGLEWRMTWSAVLDALQCSFLVVSRSENASLFVWPIIHVVPSVRKKLKNSGYRARFMRVGGNRGIWESEPGNNGWYSVSYIHMLYASLCHMWAYAFCELSNWCAKTGDNQYILRI